MMVPSRDTVLIEVVAALAVPNPLKLAVHLAICATSLVLAAAPGKAYGCSFQWCSRRLDSAKFAASLGFLASRAASRGGLRRLR